MSKIFTVAVLLFSSATGFGQTEYKGLIPGASTRAVVEAVLGPPVSSVSKTLIEYKSPENVGKVYVQYRDESASARVERIELVCEGSQPRAEGESSPCFHLILPMAKRLTLGVAGYITDAEIKTSNALYPSKNITYYAHPLFVVFTNYTKTNTEYELRLGYYSKELYEAGRPKGSCRGTIFGDWEAKISTPQGELSLGLLTIKRMDDYRFQGTYSAGKGTLSGRFFPAEQRVGKVGSAMGKAGPMTGSASHHLLQKKGVTIIGESFRGDWKDEISGSGTFEFRLDVDRNKDFFNQVLRGKWLVANAGSVVETAFEARCLR